ncbi:hypothetical protein CAEBREN_20933 [Caenorhabditis brenneri]|uniref:Uncharacterized protein n=1 Tax=Caenorhabditis brenneri TaxID=135651 RepID=G0NN15_CAEBE|nr:hypothetical protein CAEBREN_20933 [Caenorhabditis brenneri]
MYTVQFCILRMVILYSMSEDTLRLNIISFPFISLFAASLAALPHLLSDGMCIQMGGQYPFGSISVISFFYYADGSRVSMEDMIFIGLTCLVIIVLNGFMFNKLREIKNLQQTSNHTRKVERTLTRTIIILLIPLVVHFTISTSVLIKIYEIAPEFLSLFSMTRPAMLDIRTNIVALYFYFTHPVFKKETVVLRVSSFKNLRSEKI